MLFRSDREHLVDIAAHGFDAVEVFAVRDHFDYRDRRAAIALAEWLDDTRLRLHSMHAPIAARYVNGPALISTREQSSFYLPGVSPGISTPYDIPTNAVQTDPASWLAAIVAASTEVVVDGSKLEPWAGSIYRKTVTYGQMADALESVAINA